MKAAIDCAMKGKGGEEDDECARCRERWREAERRANGAAGSACCAYFFLFMAATRARRASRLEEVEGAGAAEPSAATPTAGDGAASPAYT